MKSNRFWIVLLAVLLAASGGLAWYLLRDKTDGTVANVYQDGTCIRSIDLSAVDEPYTFTVAGDDGSYNVVSVEQGRICVSEASCPDQICVHQGWISTGVTPVVCLPNKLVIRIETSAESSSGVDAVSQ